MIQLKNIEFSYRKKGAPALSGVTATIGPGVHLLAGENGAGKTTLLHLIAGVATPTRGECLLFGHPASSGRPSEMGRVFLVEENMEFPGSTIIEFARLHSRFYPSFSHEQFMANLAAFGLTGSEPLRSASLGNRKKAQLSYALALGVDLLLLDEPTNGLDIESRNVLRRLLSQVDVEKTVIVATHSVSELECLFDGAILLTRSRLLFAGSEEALTRRLAFRVTRSQEPDALYSEIQAGRVLGIFRNEAEEDATRVDWRLFYSAMHSDKRQSITKVLIEQ